MNKIVTTQEMADLLDVHRHTIAKMLEDGRLGGLDLVSIYKYAYEQGWVARGEDIIKLIKK